MVNQNSVEPADKPSHNLDGVQPKKPIFWLAGLVIVIIVLAGISAYAFSITPVPTILTVPFWIGFVFSGGFGWLWMGVDAIPGKRKRSFGAFHSWLVVGLTFFGGVLLTYVPLIGPAGYAFFPAFVLSMAAKVGWTYGYNGRIRYCLKCARYRWFLRLNGDWYCNKKGHKWYGSEHPMIKP